MSYVSLMIKISCVNFILVEKWLFLLSYWSASVMFSVLLLLNTTDPHHLPSSFSDVVLTYGLAASDCFISDVLFPTDISQTDSCHQDSVFPCTTARQCTPMNWIPFLLSWEVSNCLVNCFLLCTVYPLHCWWLFSLLVSAFCIESGIVLTIPILQICCGAAFAWGFLRMLVNYLTWVRTQ